MKVKTLILLFALLLAGCAAEVEGEPPWMPTAPAAMLPGAAIFPLGNPGDEPGEEQPPPRPVPEPEPWPAGYSARVPILMYHTSSEAMPRGLTELYVMPSRFEAQLEYLRDNGYTTCTFDDWPRLPEIDKPVFLTFDDGYLANYTEIFPILQKYGAKITIFLAVGHMEANGLTEEMVREMSDSGLVKFESHTVSHYTLDSISSNTALLEKELSESKDYIEDLTGRKVLSLAYPVGKSDAVSLRAVARHYDYGLRSAGGIHTTRSAAGEYLINRIYVPRSMTLSAFVKALG